MVNHKLKPCPLCQSGNVAEHEKDNPLVHMFPDSPRFYWVQCDSCKAMSRRYVTRDLARHNWNDRVGITRGDDAE